MLDDFHGFRRHEIPLDAIVIDSPWATQYNTWEFNPHQFPDAPATVSMMRADGVRTVVWVTPWTNLDSRDGQIPPQPESERLHREPASNYAPGAAAGHFVLSGSGSGSGSGPGFGSGSGAREPFVAQWWMGTGSPVDFTSPAAEEWWREQAKRVLSLGVEGIKADDGEGYYIPDHVRLFDGRSGASAAWALGGLHRLSMQRALDEVHGDRGVLFGRSGWTGQQAVGLTWGGDQASDFWSLRVLVVAMLTAACSGISNWSHDVGGYLGHRLVERCPPELLVRWLQFGCFTPLMQAHARMPQEPWNYGERVLDLYRGYVLLHERLVPYVRAAALTASRTGLPIIRPLCPIDPSDPRGWTIGDGYGYGPALWVAPVLDDRAREREVALPRGHWIETWSGSWCVEDGRSSLPRRCTRSPSGPAPARSSSPTRPRMWRAGWVTGPSPSGRSRRRSGVPRRWGTRGAARRRDADRLAAWAMERRARAGRRVPRARHLIARPSGPAPRHPRGPEARRRIGLDLGVLIASVVIGVGASAALVGRLARQLRL